MYRTIINEMDATTLAARVDGAGVLVDGMLSWRPQSDWATLAAGFSNPAKVSLARLPNLPYVLAAGGVADQNEKAVDLSNKMTARLLSGMGLDFPEETTKRITKVSEAICRQVTGVQVVVGGAPPGSGVFGLAYVLECKDANAAKAIVSDYVALILSMIRNIPEADPEFEKITISYVKKAQSVGNISVDAIVVSHPEMEDMDEEDREQMKAIFGEDKLRVLVAAVDDKTLVMTLGGSTAMLEAAIKAARGGGGGKILSPGLSARIAKYLPAKTTCLCLFNAGNLMDVIAKGAQALGGEGLTPIPFRIATKAPVVLAGGVTGKAHHVVVQVPSGLIKEVIQGIQKVLAEKFLGGRGSGPPDTGF